MANWRRGVRRVRLSFGAIEVTRQAEGPAVKRLTLLLTGSCGPPVDLDRPGELADTPGRSIAGMGAKFPPVRL